MVKLSLHQFVR